LLEGLESRFASHFRVGFLAKKRGSPLCVCKINDSTSSSFVLYGHNDLTAFVTSWLGRCTCWQMHVPIVNLYRRTATPLSRSRYRHTGAPNQSALYTCRRDEELIVALPRASLCMVDTQQCRSTLNYVSVCVLGTPALVVSKKAKIFTHRY